MRYYGLWLDKMIYHGMKKLFIMIIDDYILWDIMIYDISWDIVRYDDESEYINMLALWHSQGCSANTFVIKQIDRSSFVEISSKHLHFQTIRARGWHFEKCSPHPPCVPCHMAYVTCHMSLFTCHKSVVVYQNF